MKAALRPKKTEAAARMPTPARPEPAVTVVVRPEVIRSIADAAGAAGPRETGEPLIGTIQPSWEQGGERLIASILGSVPAGPHVHGRVASVALGDAGDGERAASALRWWRKVTGLDLRHLGDWHKHPSGVPQPSQGDRATARNVKAESSAAVWLSAIAVCDHARTHSAVAEGAAVTFTDEEETLGKVRFYREMDRTGLTPIEVRVEEHAIPALPLLPWHIADSVRFAAECRLLQAAGFLIAIEPSITRSGAGLALKMTSPDGESFVVMTGRRYPLAAPKLFDAHGRKTAVENGWSPARFLVDLVKEQK